jgi:hypothetical protein
MHAADEVNNETRRGDTGRVSAHLQSMLQRAEAHRYL